MNIKDKLKVMDEISAANRQHVEDWKMKNRRIKGVLIDTVKGTAEITEIDKSLDGYYKVLNCRCIDIVQRYIGNRCFEIICDDEAALADAPLPSAVSPLGEVMLYGNLLVVRFDGEDDVESLTDADIVYILSNHLLKLHVARNGKPHVHTVLDNVSYDEKGF